MKTPPSSSISIKILAVLWLASTFGLAAPAQQATPPAKSDDTKSESAPAKAPLTPEEKKRADLLADTEKLYKLSQELKAEVAKSNKDTLSVSVVKKAQEVERLAKSIKDRSRSQ
jgi:type VI protein secretion system component VasF